MDEAAAGEVRARYDLNQIIEFNLRVVDDGDSCIDDLMEIVRWDVGGHANSDTGRTVHQKIWQ